MILDKIRSSVILKKVFMYISNKKKLNTIVYNKKIQKKLGLDLYDFIRFSCKKYKEGINNEIKIYNYNDTLLFEGQYSNRNKNGNGKEYNEEGKLIFEGEYLDGKKWIGKENVYDENNGELIFEYKYKNGKIIHGKEYDKYNHELLFSGEYLNGKRNGFGEEYRLICERHEDKYHYNISKENPKLIKIFSGKYFNGERKEG